MVLTYEKDGLVLTDDKSKIDLDVVHAFLRTAYWSAGIPKETVEKSIQNSICYSVLESDRQVGFARVVTDLATFAYLADVFVLEGWRGRGISKWMISAIVGDARFQLIRRFMLVTRDAQGLYQRYGFRSVNNPDGIMEITKPLIYKQVVDNSNSNAELNKTGTR